MHGSTYCSLYLYLYLLPLLGLGQASPGVCFVTVVVDTVAGAPHGHVTTEEVEALVAYAMESMPAVLPPKPADCEP